MATNRNPKNRKNLNVRKGEKGFQRSQPKAKTPKSNNQPVQRRNSNAKLSNQKQVTPTTQSMNSTFDNVNEKIAQQQKRALKQHSANEKLKTRRATLKTVRDKQKQAEKLKTALMEARDGTPQQRKAMENILTKIVNKPGLRIKVNWNI